LGNRATCLAAGMNDYVAKPFQPPILFAAIDRWTPTGVKSPPFAAAEVDLGKERV
jgi:two-component system, sensor histidine kinase